MKMLSHVTETISSQKFYAAQKDGTLSEAFGYFFKLLLLVSLITTILSIFSVIRLSKIVSSNTLGKIAGYYPAELVVTIKDGKASSNVQEPYKIAFPADLLEGSDQKIPFENIIVIDTTHQPSPDTFLGQETFALLTKDYLITREKNDKISLQSLSSIKDAHVDRKLVDTIVARISPYLKLVLPLAFVAVFVASYVFNAIGSLILLLIVALVAWVISLIRHQDVSYRTWYRYGLFAITASLALDLILSGTGLHTPWYINTLVVLAVLFVHVKKGSHA